MKGYIYLHLGTDALHSGRDILNLKPKEYPYGKQL